MTDPEDPTTLNDRPPCLQGSVHLVVGPVGAGKSTRAIAFAHAHRAVRLTLDDWMTRLFRPDRPAEGVVPWYVERAARCVDQIWLTACEIIGTGTSVVLEIGLLSRREREAFYARVDEAGVRLVVHVVDAPREERRVRVMQRNEERGATFSMVVPPEVFELASDLWEPPDDAELATRAAPPDAELAARAAPPALSPYRAGLSASSADWSNLSASADWSNLSASADWSSLSTSACWSSLSTSA